MYQGKELIQDPKSWCDRNLGKGFDQTDQVLLNDYPHYLMTDFPGHKQHCTLTALTSVFMYFKARGYDFLPSDPQTLFRRIRRLARTRIINYPAFLFFKGGTIPFFVDRLVKLIWRFYGYPHGRGRNRIFMLSGRRAELFVKEEIEAGRPFLLSIHSGYYKNHTVTVWGYEVWTRVNSEGEEEKRVMLRINDHWSEDPRYIDLYSLDPAFGGPFFEFCQIMPPSLEEVRERARARRDKLARRKVKEEEAQEQDRR